MSKNPDPEVIRPIEGHCGLHGKVLDIPVKPLQYDYHIWICIVCVVNGMWNEDITEKVRKNWPTEFKLGPLALREHLKKAEPKTKRKGATGA